jgi:hypothetical protein
LSAKKRDEALKLGRARAPVGEAVGGEDQLVLSGRYPQHRRLSVRGQAFST